jgi:hypothetical protein
VGHGVVFNAQGLGEAPEKEAVEVVEPLVEVGCLMAVEYEDGAVSEFEPEAPSPPFPRCRSLSTTNLSEPSILQAGETRRVGRDESALLREKKCTTISETRLRETCTGGARG